MNDEFNTISDNDVKLLLESEGFMKLRALRIAEDKAREKAGIRGISGYVEFSCPHCGGMCASDFHSHRGELHGSMGCPKCKIGVRV